MNWKTKQKKLPQSEEGKVDEKNKQSLRGLWDYKKISNICVIRIPEGVIKEGRAEKILKETGLMIALKGFVKLCVCVCVRERERERALSPVQLFETPWTAALPVPLSTGFSRQAHWRGLCSSRGPFQPRVRTCVSCIASGSFTIWATMEAPSVKLNKPQTR